MASLYTREGGEIGCGYIVGARMDELDRRPNGQAAGGESELALIHFETLAVNV